MILAKNDREIIACFDVMRELRPHLKRESFLADVRAMQSEGFQLGYLLGDDEVVSVAGFRVYLDFAAKGKALYVYDLVTSDSYRSKGFGKQMILAIQKIAQDEGCTLVHLDSAVHRHRAHKFYMLHGYSIQAHHFITYLV